MILVESARLAGFGARVFEITGDCLFEHLRVSGAMVGR
jgi:hypothetical protein